MRWYNVSEKRRETIQQILAILNGIPYKEAKLILECTLEELSFSSFVACQDKSNHQQYAQNLNKGEG